MQLATGFTSGTLSDIRRDAHRGPSHLRGQAETLFRRKTGRICIHRRDEVHGVVPDLQALMRPLFRITNHESRIPAFQPITNSGWSNSIGWPFSTITFNTVPATSASIGLNIFIASMMPSVSPALTAWPTVTNAGLSGEGEP